MLELVIKNTFLQFTQKEDATQPGCKHFTRSKSAETLRRLVTPSEEEDLSPVDNNVQWLPGKLPDSRPNAPFHPQRSLTATETNVASGNSLGLISGPEEGGEDGDNECATILELKRLHSLLAQACNAGKQADPTCTQPYSYKRDSWSFVPTAGRFEGVDTLMRSDGHAYSNRIGMTQETQRPLRMHQ